MPAGVNRTEGSHVGTSTSLATRLCPFDSKKARYFSRSSSVFIGRGQGSGFGGQGFPVVFFPPQSPPHRLRFSSTKRHPPPLPGSQAHPKYTATFRTRA